MTKAHVGNIDMYYELHGEGEPLVLIGGLASDISQSAWLTDWCARTHHVLAFDNRGAGRTDKPVSSYTIPMMANDTDGLMEVVGMRRAPCSESRWAVASRWTWRSSTRTGSRGSSW